MSDFHTFSFSRREKRVLEITKEHNPDFIFILGDFVDEATRNIKACEVFWDKLGSINKAKVFGVLGNHDHRNKKIKSEDLCVLLEKYGIHILNNKSQKIFKDNSSLDLVGVDDVFTRNDDLGKALRGLDDEVPKILLSHSPDIVNKLGDFQDKGIDLILAGHTHGGQIKIPFMRPYWVPTKNMGKYASGLFKILNIPMYVNRGIGMSMFPIRFNCPPDVTVVCLEK